MRTEPNHRAILHFDSHITNVITGFNTDIEHDGVVYHVQTEDKGLETPLILSLVYSGGAILASKRARYEDLIAAGFSDEALTERLTRQHKLICAAIYAGRIEDLKRMSASGPAPTAPLTEPTEPEQQEQAQEAEESVQAEPQLEILRGDEEREALEAERWSSADEERQASFETQPEIPPFETADLTIEEKAPLPPVPPLEPVEAYSVHDQRRQSVMGDFAQATDGLRITLLGQQEFRSGENPSLKVMVGFRTGSKEQPIAKAAVSVKVLGTTFRPQLYSAKTQSDGVAAIATKIPKFSSGRAAILIRAVFEDQQTELRRVILPG